MVIIRAKSPEPCPKHNHQSNLGELPKWLWLSVLENSKKFNQSGKMRKQDTFLSFFCFSSFFLVPTLNVFVDVFGCWKKPFWLDTRLLKVDNSLAESENMSCGMRPVAVVSWKSGCCLELWIFNIHVPSCSIISHHLRHKLTTIHNTHPKHLTVPKQPMNQQVPTLHWWTKELILDFCVLISGAGAFFFNLSGGPKWPVLFIGKDLVVFGRRSG